MATPPPVPTERWRAGKQFHVLSFLGPGWAAPGCRFDLAFLADYVAKVNQVGGVVTIDMALYHDGSLDPKQLEFMSKVRPAVKELTKKGK